MIKLFSGKRLYTTLVHWGKVEFVGKDIVWTPDETKYAIPGGGVSTEKEVRRWARQEGFLVKKDY